MNRVSAVAIMAVFMVPVAQPAHPDLLEVKNPTVDGTFSAALQ